MPELSYQLIGLSFEMFKKLGYGYQEKYYHRGYAELLKREKIPFHQELMVPIKFENKIIGRYFIDFLIDGKIALEFKIANDFYPKHYKQVLGYIKAKKLPLGILILITAKSIRYRRIVNTKEN